MAGFMDWFSGHYEVLRACHIIAVIAWMCGLMYLPRIFVYHSKAEIGSELDNTLITMESKLYNFIMQPSMVVVWCLGLSLIMARGGMLFLENGFMMVKLTAVSLITIIHFFYGKWQRDFANHKRPLSHVFYRIINEAPFILMMIGIFMVVLEPKLF